MGIEEAREKRCKDCGSIFLVCCENCGYAGFEYI